MKKVFHFIVFILIIYTLFVMTDSIRIGEKEKQAVRPFITISEDENNNTLTYTGLGYKVSYNFEKEWISDDEIDYNIHSAEFKVFNFITLWKWSEEVQ